MTMEHGDVETYLWNLSRGLAVGLALAACGPQVVLEGDTDTDPTIGGGECNANGDCPSGQACFEGQCIDYYGDTACGSGGCCGYEYDPDCYDDPYYDTDYEPDTDTDTDSLDCETTLDCAPPLLCTDQGVCEGAPALPACPAAPMVVVQDLPTASVDLFFSLALVDANGDPAQDVVVGRNGSAELLLGPGDGAPILLPVSSGAVVDATSGDLDGDGQAELVLSTLEGALRVLTSDGAGGYAETPVSSISVPTRELATLQWDGDGLLDLVGRTDNGRVLMLLGDGAGGFSDALDFLVEPPVLSVAPSDLDGDAFGDVVLQDGDGVKRFRGSNAGVLVGDGIFPGSEDGARMLSSAAIDPETPFEVVGTTYDPEGTRVELWFNGASQQFYGLTGSRHAAGMGDVDGDGAADLVVGGDLVVEYVLGSPASGLACTSTVEYPGLLFDMVVGDFDGNLRADVVIGNGRGITVLASQ